jgi:Flp pilus assembly protein CpaB
MSDNELMLSLIALMTAFGALGLLSLKFGVDSRRDERNL